MAEMDKIGVEHAAIGAAKNDAHANADTGSFLKMAAVIPTKPAGPGGDQPNPNPFPIKTPEIPFGKRSG